MKVEEELRLIKNALADLNIRVTQNRQMGGSHNLLSITHPDTDPDTPQVGDLIRGVSGPEWERLGIGAANEVLTVSGGLPAWLPAAAGGGGAEFEDNFDDASIYWAWVSYNTGVGKTISEAAGVLTIALTGGTNGRWDAASFVAPSAHIGVIGEPFSIVAKLNSFSINDDTAAGIFMHTRTGTNYTYLLERHRDDGVAKNGIRAERLGTELAINAVTTLPIWLRIRSSGCHRLRSIQYFDYSTDGSSWTNLTSDSSSGFFPSTYGVSVGMYVRNWAAAYNAISVPFDLFTMTIDAGPG